jgi:hypothetical protein
VLNKIIVFVDILDTGSEAFSEIDLEPFFFIICSLSIKAHRMEGREGTCIL